MRGLICFVLVCMSCGVSSDLKPLDDPDKMSQAEIEKVLAEYTDYSDEVVSYHDILEIIENNEWGSDVYDLLAKMEESDPYYIESRVTLILLILRDGKEFPQDIVSQYWDQFSAQQIKELAHSFYTHYFRRFDFIKAEKWLHIAKPHNIDSLLTEIKQKDEQLSAFKDTITLADLELAGPFSDEIQMLIHTILGDVNVENPYPEYQTYLPFIFTRALQMEIDKRVLNNRYFVFSGHVARSGGDRCLIIWDDQNKTGVIYKNHWENIIYQYGFVDDDLITDYVSKWIKDLDLDEFEIRLIDIYQ